ncbi:TonB-dependent receptor [Biformimicrobium ophioploci]|uniref:TonB-dependent receptor n=1 Tax=Biformimicrobium ophioploci TaxID=3036711 RepID=A0ABQ6M0U6_9GAMM|nr:TonB-dependent receptor [Microbulbifer sp. NKW57]GMG87963.1 hypothetical protein MNKW57_22840 [Microbulbifer sp. NKW57]
MMRYKTLAAAIAASNLALAAQTFAQAEDAETTITNDDGAMEQVIVTATKRETELMDTPIAISAFTEEHLEKMGIKNVKDLNHVVPNLNIMVDNESSAPIITLRGVRSTNTTEWGDPAVGVHYDGIYSPRPQGALALMFDIERVEVLRGPQGTLFGRNSTVGSMNIISAKPDFEEQEGKLEVEAGKWNARSVKGMFNLPVTDTFAVRAAYMSSSNDSSFDGYWDPNQFDPRYLNLDPSDLVPVESASSDAGNNWDHTMFFSNGPYQEIEADPEDFYGAGKQYAFRLSAAWDINENMRWNGGVERFRDKGKGWISGRDCERIEDRPVVYESWGARMDGTGSCTDLWGTEDNFTAYVNVPGDTDMTLDSYRSRFEWDVTEGLQLSYVSGFQSQERSGQIDLDQGLYYYDQMLKWADTQYDSWSHEIMLASTGDSKLQWQAGYFNFKEDNDMNGHWQSQQYGAAIWRQPERIIKSEAIFAQGTYELTEDLYLTLGARRTWDSKEDIGGRNYGCWGSCFMAQYGFDPETGPGSIWDVVRWDLIDWGLPASEQSQEFKDAKQALMDAYQAAGADYFDTIRDSYAVDTENDVFEKWAATTWRVGLDYDISDDTMVYGYVANGYKGGGIGDVLFMESTITPENPTGDRFDTSYDPETVTTYEMGIKTRLFDDRLNLRANLFFSDYEGQQQTAWTNYDAVLRDVVDAQTQTVIQELQPVGTFLTRNLDDSTIKGIELEAEFAPWDGGFIGGYLTMLDTEISSDYWKKWGSEPAQVFANFEDSTPDVGVDPDEFFAERPWYRNMKGNDLPYAPKYSLAVNMSHTFTLGNGDTISPWINFSWTDESYTDMDNRDTWDIAQEDLRVYEGFDADGNPLSYTANPDFYTDTRDAYYIVNASLRYESANKAWFAEGYVHNLTDEDVNWSLWYAGNTPMANKARKSWSVKFGYQF